MKKLLALAAFLLASSAAQAQYTFEYGGRTIRIDPDRGTVSIPGVYDNTGRRTKRSHSDQDGDRSRKQTPQQAKVDPQAPVAEPAEQAPAPANTPPASSPPTANVAPADTAASTPVPAAPASGRRDRAASSARRRPRQARNPRNDCDDRTGAETSGPCGSAGQFAARRVADRREGRQGANRAMRRQPLRLFRGLEIEPERRTGSDEHEARQKLQMERANSRSLQRQHL